jgi:type I restriction enzyme S subunit
VDCSIGRGLAALRATSTVDQRYLFWALRASEQLLASHGTGSTFEAITGKQLKEHPVPVPPLEVQRRIVDILEDHLSRLDAAARQIESANRRVLSWQRAHADELFWSREHPTFELGDLLASPLRNGHSARASASGEGIRTLTLTAVTRGQFTDDFTKLTTADPKRVADLWLRSGDILVQRSNTPELVGTTELYSGPDDWAIFPDLLIRCRVDPARVLPAFAAGAMRTERAHRWLRVRAKGLAGSMPKIDQGTIAALRIPVPVRSEQVAIVARLAELDAATARLAASCTLAAARGVALRRALLQAALTGRLTRSTLDVQQLETVRV